MTGPEFLAAFEQLTGIKFRLGAHYAQAQAIALAREGFTVADLELVILWTKRESARTGRGLSYAWHTLMGNHGEGAEFTCFQERLGLAQAAVANGWRPAFKLSAPEANPTIRSNRTTEVRANPEAGPAIAKQLRELRLRLSGRAFPGQ